MNEILKRAIALLEEADQLIEEENGFETVDGEGYYTKCRSCGATSTMSWDDEDLHASDCLIEINNKAKRRLTSKLRCFLDEVDKRIEDENA